MIECCPFKGYIWIYPKHLTPTIFTTNIQLLRDTSLARPRHLQPRGTALAKRCVSSCPKGAGTRTPPRGGIADGAGAVSSGKFRWFLGGREVCLVWGVLVSWWGNPRHLGKDHGFGVPGTPNVPFFQATLSLKPATIALKIGHLAFQVYIYTHTTKQRGKTLHECTR